MLNLPEGIYSDDFNLDQLSEQERNKTMKYLRAYFNLCSEEFDLWNSGLVEQKTWSIWQEEIRFSMSKNFYKKAWQVISSTVPYNEAYSSWITGLTLEDEDAS